MSSVTFTPVLTGYINYRGPLGQSQYKNYQFTFSLFTIQVAARNVENLD